MSSNDWMQVKLKDVADYGADKVDISKISKMNYISTANMLPNKSGIEVSESLPNIKRVNKGIIGDTLISNIRPYFKKIWYCNSNYGVSSDVLIIKPDDEKIYSKYLYYFLSQDRFFDFMVSTSKGTKMPRGDKTAIMNYNFNIPPYSKQIEISNLFTSIDNKIEINNQINQTLGEMAQAIFKHWFIDFEFPNENGEPYKSSGGKFMESELGMIPEGWEICNVKDICDVSSSKRVFLKDYVPSGIPFYRSKEIIEKNKGNIISTELFISESHYDQLKEKYGVPVQGDILLTSVGTLGIPYLVGSEEFYFKDGNLTWFRNFRKDGLNLYLYYWLVSKEGQTNLDYITIGSTQKALTITALRNIQILIPNYDVIIKFLDIFNNINRLIDENILQNYHLNVIRDTLLPKLMSGEIRIPDAEQEVEACLQKSN